MGRQSPQYSGRTPKQSRTAVTLRIATAAATLALVGATAASQASAQTAQAEVGYVAAVSGRVVALSGRAPVLLEPLDSVLDQARLDIQAGGELRMCHFATQRLVTLKGPMRAFVAADAVTAENGRRIDLAAAPCVTPQASKHQGGLVARGTILVGNR